MCSYLKRAALAASNRYTAAGVAMFGSMSAFADIDATTAVADITTAQTSAETVGTAVIGAVAALVVVGLIIGLIRKL